MFSEHLKAHKTGCDKSKTKKNEIKNKELQKNPSKCSLKVGKCMNHKCGYCVFVL